MTHPANKSRTGHITLVLGEELNVEIPNDAIFEPSQTTIFERMGSRAAIQDLAGDGRFDHLSLAHLI